MYAEVKAAVAFEIEKYVTFVSEFALPKSSRPVETIDRTLNFESIRGTVVDPPYSNHWAVSVCIGNSET